MYDHALSPETRESFDAYAEGINLYAGMLEYPVEDAQVAEEAVLTGLVKRLSELSSE